MRTVAPWTEQWQHFVTDVREQFWGDVAQHTRQTWADFLGRPSIEARDRYRGCGSMSGARPVRMPARRG